MKRQKSKSFGRNAEKRGTEGDRSSTKPPLSDRLKGNKESSETSPADAPLPRLCLRAESSFSEVLGITCVGQKSTLFNGPFLVFLC